MLIDETATENAPKRRYPVLIDLHGGGFMSGSSMNNNGAHLANKHQMVVVHANYRLAEFGYWYSDSEPESANAGFLDQQLAIEWVSFFFSNPKNYLQNKQNLFLWKLEDVLNS